MLNITSGEEQGYGHDHDDDDDHRHRHRDSTDEIRDIHPLTPPVPTNRGRPRDPSWETLSYISMPSEGGSSETFSTMSREFSALVVAGSELGPSGGAIDGNGNALSRIREEEETNPLAIVPDRSDPLGDPEPAGRGRVASAAAGTTSLRGNLGPGDGGLEVSVERVKKEEVETKITAWQTAKIEKINNRFKREDAVISGWESERVHKATSWMKKVERKLDEKRARAMEKMQNEMAQTHRKAEERRASAEAKRATKAARILELANLMRVAGRPPAKRSFF